MKVASAAAVEWGTSPLSRRSALLFRLRELIDAHRDDLAAIVTSEHGKTLDDARGEVARGLDCVEFACGVPQLLKGEHSSEVVERRRRPHGPAAGRRRRGHHPVQLPRDGPVVDARQRARVRKRVRAQAVREGSLAVAAAGRARAAGRIPGRRLQRGARRCRGGRRAVDPPRCRRGLVRREHAGGSSRVRDGHAARQACASAGRGEEPHGRATRRRRRRGRRRRDLRGLRVGGRAVHGHLGRRRGGRSG